MNIATKTAATDPFFIQNGYSYDYVIVFKIHEEKTELTLKQKQYSMKSILHDLATGGLETKMFYSSDRNIVFCKIRANLMRLKKEAERINYKLELDEKELARMALRGMPEKNIKPIRIDDVKNVSDRTPFQNVFASYSLDEKLQILYKKYTSYQIPFRGVDRLKLLHSILTSRKAFGGCRLKLKKLVHDQCILAYFPLHSDIELEELKQNWINWCAAPSQQPLADIKDYFGEKIGLYFGWLGHYTAWLVAPSIIGTLVTINAYFEANFDASSLPYFGLFMAVWSTLYLECWKQRNSTLAMEWGMTGFETSEQNRPEFHGEEIPSPITGHTVLYFNPWKKFRRVLVSLLFVFVMLLVVAGVVAGIFIVKYYARPDYPLAPYFTYGGRNFSVFLASIANGAQIQIMNVVYGNIAKVLNDYENHRTDTEYEDYLIGKTFLFQFVNSYASCFYIGFIKQMIGEECSPDCLTELSFNLGVIFIVRLTSGNFMEIVWPKLVNQRTQKRENTLSRPLSAVQKQYLLGVYDDMGTFADYSEMVIQFGYATLFACAFPLAPLLALINNYIEIRIDALKLCAETRRPLPRSAEDIGTWYTFLQIMGTISVVTNTALIIFTSDRMTYLLPDIEYRLWAFLAIENIVVLLKFAASAYISDIPDDVELQLARGEYLTEKLILGVPDDTDDDLIHAKSQGISLCVHDNDNDDGVQVII